ncbi:MAG: putative iron-sulfur cluster scaffold NifU-like [Rhodospirillaceae bacterium]|nr:MAG: putative iron-sulfur cluster scaffold NifU-like [Rhodospirillaceae bacterium]
MFIQTEPTPNPASLKFLPGRSIMARGTADFPSPDTARSSPLAQRLFDVQGVRGVFLGSDFVTITKIDGTEWSLLKPAVLGALAEHFLSGDAVVHERPVGEGAENEEDEEDADAEGIVRRIRELLDTRVRPAVARDGGDIIFRAFRDGVVYLRLQGSCSGCPSSTATLKNGIENLLQHYIPEVLAVRAVD